MIITVRWKYHNKISSFVVHTSICFINHILISKKVKTRKVKVSLRGTSYSFYVGYLSFYMDCNSNQAKNVD